MTLKTLTCSFYVISLSVLDFIYFHRTTCRLQLGEKAAMERKATIHFPCNDNESLMTSLVDFKICHTNQLWVITVNADNQMALAVCDIYKQEWQEVTLDSPPSQDVRTRLFHC